MKADGRSYEYPARYRYGEANPAARLSERQVLEIKRLLARGAGYRFLAQRFGVSRTTIGRIARGEGWQHVPWPVTRRVHSCPHYDVPYQTRRCRRCGAEFEVCPRCARGPQDGLCPTCEKETDEA